MTICRPLWAAGVVLACLPFQLSAAITGLVLRAGDLTPIADARIRLQADPASPIVLTGADGRFTLPVTPPGGVVVTATVPYDPNATVNYPIEQVNAFDGSDVLILLFPLPATDNPTYQPPTVNLGCAFCHQEQADRWLTSNHAHAAVNEWVLDLFSGSGTPGGGAGYVYRDTHDPGETGFCAVCHAPLADVFNPGNVMLDEVVSPGALDGVQCLACHQIHDVNGNVSALNHLGNSEYRFPNEEPTQLFVWGPLDDVGFSTMNALYTPLFKESRLCAACHEYNNPDTGAPGQNTYSEWLASPWAVPGPDFRTCQDCHMPPAAEPGPISSLGGTPIRPPEDRRQHDFIGATPERLSAAITLDLEAELVGDQVIVTARVTNAGAGHAFPTGVSVRNALLQLAVSAAGAPLPQSAGQVIPFWADDDVPGKQDGDLAGEPGAGFARVLEGRINGAGPVVRPVLFIDAENVAADTRIASGETRTEMFRFAATGVPPGAAISVTAEVRYRRAWRATYVTKGWTQTPSGGPLETQVATAATLLLNQAPAPIPALGPGGLLLLILAVMALVLKVGLRPPPPVCVRT